MTSTDDEGSRITREITARAIRRLDMLGWLILAVAAGLAVLAGALVAFLLASSVGLPFRATWIVSAALLFLVPGALTLLRDRAPHRGKPRDVDPGALGRPPSGDEGGAEPVVRVTD